MKVSIILNTEEQINIELYKEEAPISVNNFIKLVNEHYYDNTVFHRIIKGFMIQTGGYKVEGDSLLELGETPTIKGEFNENGINNPIKHELGVISMARTNDPNSATSQFFICAGKPTWLDGKYAAFGKTIDEESNQVVLKIASMPTFDLGGGFQNFPQYDIKITTIKVIEE